MKVLAASAFFERGRDREVPRPQPVAVVVDAFLVREDRVGDLVGDGRLLRIGDERPGRGGVDPHAALALLEQRQVLVEAVRRGALRARVLHQVGVELQRRLPLGLVELRGPLLVEPAGAEAVGHRADQRHVLAPAGLAAQADAVDVGRAVGHLAGRVADELPGRVLGHGEPGLLEEVGAVHQEGALAVEGRGVELAVDGQAAADRRQHVVDLVGGVELERHQPALLAPDRHLVVADGQDVVLAAAGGDVGRHPLAQDVLLERHPVHRDVGVRLVERAGQALHADHVAVVHGRDRDRLGIRRRGEGKGGRRPEQEGKGSHDSSGWMPISGQILFLRAIDRSNVARCQARG